MHVYETKESHDADYNYKSANYLEPWVAYTEQTREVSFNYNHPYLTFTALASGTFSLKIPANVDETQLTSVSFSLDGGETWNTTANTSSVITITTPTVQTGDTVLWKGNGTAYGAENNYDDSKCSIFSSTCDFDVYGNIMSLLHGDNYKNVSTITTEWAFYALFSASRIKDAANLILPATTLANYCYAHMFSGCTALTTAPELPATTLNSNCYLSMFRGCTALTTAPELPATTLASNCYLSMFNGCKALTTAPALPATTLASNCYSSMFIGCTALTTAPELPATTLAIACYASMFNGCTALTTAPDLPATTLTSNCYYQMFYGCAKLNHIKAMFTTRPSTTYTNNWVKSVASTGRFIKNSSATWNVTGVNGVPSGWTVETASS